MAAMARMKVVASALVVLGGGMSTMVLEIGISLNINAAMLKGRQKVMPSWKLQAQELAAYPGPGL